MKIIEYELIKIKGSSKLIKLLIGFLILNFILSLNSFKSFSFSKEDYSFEFKTFINTKDKSIYLDLDKTRTLSLKNYELMKYFSDYVGQIESYSKYLADVKNMDKKSPAFMNESAFDLRDREKTAKAFSKLPDRKLSYTNSLTLISSIESKHTDILIISLLVYFIYSVLKYEMDSNIFNMINSSKVGYKKLIGAKILTCFLFSLVFVCLFYTVNLLTSIYQFGGIDYSLPLQSLYSYDTNPLNIKIGTFILIFIAFKILMVFIIGFFAMLLLLRTKDIALSLIVFASFILMEYLSYSNFSSLSLLKIPASLNLIPFLKVYPIIKHYYNLNFFSYPVNRFNLYIILIIFFTVILSILALKSKGKVFCYELRFLKAFSPKAISSLSYYEFYKLIFNSKALYLISFLFIIQTSSYLNRSFSLSSEDKIYKNYMIKLEGNLTKEKLDYLKKEDTRFRELKKEIDDVADSYQKGKINENIYLAYQRDFSEKMAYYPSFMRVLDKVNHTLTINKSRNQNYPLIYDAGYDYIFNNNIEARIRNKTNSLYASLSLILILSSYFSYDKELGIENLIASCKNGRSIKKKIRLIHVLILNIIVFFMAYFYDFIYTLKVYGLSYLKKPALSLSSQTNFSSPLMVFIILIYMIRLSSLLAVSSFVYKLSQRLNSATKLLFASFSLVVLPIILSIMGFKYLEQVMFNPGLEATKLILSVNTFKSSFYLVLYPIIISLGLI